VRVGNARDRRLSTLGIDVGNTCQAHADQFLERSQGHAGDESRADDRYPKSGRRSQAEDLPSQGSCWSEIGAGVGVDTKHIGRIDQRRVSSEEQPLYANLRHHFAGNGQVGKCRRQLEIDIAAVRYQTSSFA